MYYIISEWICQEDSFNIISTNCTRPEIIKINTMVCKNKISNCSRTYFCSKYVIMVEIVITKATAPLIPRAVLIFLDTPKNGQIPKNCDNTMLFTKTAAIKILMFVAL